MPSSKAKQVEWMRDYRKRCKPNLTDIVDNELGESVYFIVDDTSNAVKIGRSKSPQKRLEALQSNNPNKIRLAKVIPNSGQRLEIHLQDRFSTAKLNGEWFRLTQEIQDFIDSVIPMGVLEGVQPDSEGYYPAWAITSWRQFNGRVRQMQLPNCPDGRYRCLNGV